MTWLAVAGGGALGALVRWIVSGLVLRGGGAPVLGTLAVNVVGCFLIGWIAGWTEHRGALDPTLRFALVTGFLGAFTTFSAFGIETLDLVQRGHAPQAIAYVLGSVGFGLAAVWAGMKLA